MKWLFSCLQVSWLGEKEVTRYCRRSSSWSISRQAGSRKSLQSSERATSPKTAGSKGARHSPRSEPCLPQLCRVRRGGTELSLILCLPRAKRIPNHGEAQEHHGIFEYGLCSPIHWPYWNGSVDMQVWCPGEAPSCLVRMAFGKKLKVIFTCLRSPEL